MRRLLHRLAYRPRQMWLRRALFQVHLWAGLMVGLYILAIGISGSILVFRAELEALGYSEEKFEGKHADIVEVAARIRAARPNSILHMVLTPTREKPVFRAYLEESGRLAVLDAGAATGRLIEPGRWQRAITWIHDLHIFLLSGEAGLKVNGIGAACLLALCASGLAIWWPGIRGWKRALVLDSRAGWKRINFDLHSVMGFWPLALITFWAVSGIYFAWPAQFVRAVRTLLPVTSAEPPRFQIAGGAGGPVADLRAVVARARELAPSATLAGISLPHEPGEPIVVDMARERPGDLLKTDYMYFHPVTGLHLATWHYGVNRTAGDWLIWLMHPLHFGTYWGLAVKIAWALLGMTLPLLTITGALMYWNRYLGRKCKARFEQAREASPVPSGEAAVRRGR